MGVGSFREGFRVGNADGPGEKFTQFNAKTGDAVVGRKAFLKQDAVRFNHCGTRLSL